MAIMTQHLTGVFNIFLNETGYGISATEAHRLTDILTSTESGHAINGKYGKFAVCRTKVWTPEADAFIHGIRLAHREQQSRTR